MTSPAPTAATSDFFFDPNAPGFNEDPFPVWAYMRENTPVYWWEPAQGWIVTNYEDVLTTLTDPRFSVEFRFYGPAHLSDEQLTPHQRLTKYGIFWLPVEAHDRVRAITAPLFTPRAVEPLRAAVRTYVAELIDHIDGKPHCDLVSDFVLNYPVGAITRILGVPGDRRPEFLRFAQGVLDAFYPAIDKDAFDSKTSYLTDGLPLVQQLIDDARTHERPGLMSALANADKDGERLTPDELLSMVGVIISAGSEPTRHLVLGALYNLLRHRDQLDILKQEPELLPNAIGEVGRYDSMGKLNFPRFALEDLQIRGVPIKAGTPVFGVFSSALRDPEVFPDPERFDIRRDLHRTLLWSKGIHNCLGRPIAQMIAEEAIRAFIDRFPHAKLHSEPVYVADSFFRKMGSLTVDLGR
ncbi:cytochrome P450 [Streptomyces sp. NPDC056069]|uniref:cytochrome P450 n=1 Tax=Streptomyces sp. NPDC056069 TaxID=3345702 RepID=UPI0035D55BE3